VLRAGRLGILRFDSRRWIGIFLFTIASRTSQGPTQPPIQWVQGALSLGVKRPGRETDHSPPSSAEVKERVELYLHSHNTPSWRGAQETVQGQLHLYRKTSTVLPFNTYSYVQCFSSEFHGVSYGCFPSVHESIKNCKSYEKSLVIYISSSPSAVWLLH
jgi:hypothetical protein